jgi:DNA-binding HxlR family transcriptional regulator
MTKDYRWGKSPSVRKQISQNLIRQALKDGKKKFKDLLEETGLSRPALAANLKEMYRNEEVKKEADPKDYRVTYYSLTSLGVNEIHRQEEVRFLDNARKYARRDDINTLFSEDIAKISDNIAMALKTMFEKGLVHTFFPTLPEDGITFSIYSISKGKETLKNAAKLAEVAKSAMLASIVTLNKNELEKISDAAIVFRFNRDKINEYLTTICAEKRKETLKLPDIDDI